MAEVCPAGALLSAPPQCLPLSLPAMCLSVSSGCVLGQGVPGAGTAPPIPPGHCLSCLCLDLWELSNSPMLGRGGLAELLLRNVPPWRNGTPTFSMWPHESPALLEPLPFSPSP